MNKVSTYSSREFTRDVAAAKRAAHEGTVYITERGTPAYVLLDINRYYQMTEKKPMSLLQAMNQIPGGEDIDFEPEKMQMNSQLVDFN
jgi:hypothetical protein